MQLESVVFLVDYGPYAPGEMAGFTADEAEKLTSTVVDRKALGKTTIARRPSSEEIRALATATRAAPSPAQPPLRRVLIVKDVGQYNVGDDPGFPPDVAADLIRRECAVAWEDAQKLEEQGVELLRRPGMKKAPKTPTLKEAPVKK